MSLKEITINEVDVTKRLERGSVKALLVVRVLKEGGSWLRLGHSHVPWHATLCMGGLHAVLRSMAHCIHSSYGGTKPCPLCEDRQLRR